MTQASWQGLAPAPVLLQLNQRRTRILRVLHIAIHCALPAAKIRGPIILEVSPCSDYSTHSDI